MEVNVKEHEKLATQALLHLENCELRSNCDSFMSSYISYVIKMFNILSFYPVPSGLKLILHII